jgi:hypothetical protein
MLGQPVDESYSKPFTMYALQSIDVPYIRQMPRFLPHEPKPRR